MNKNTSRYYALPISITETESKFLIARGSTLIDLPRNSANKLLKGIYNLFSQEGGAEISTILSQFPVETHSSIQRLIDLLIHSRFIIPIDDPQMNTPFDVFCWDFNTEPKHALGWCSAQCWYFVGTTESYKIFQHATNQYDLKRQFFEASKTLELDIDILKTHFQKDDAQSIKPVLFAFTEECNTNLLRQLNQLAIDSDVIFFPGNIINYVGLVGPTVIPKITACYECYRGRENAALFNIEVHRAAQEALQIGTVSYPPLLQEMVILTMVSNAIRFFSKFNPLEPNTLQLLKPMDGTTTVHKVLRIPFCPVCGSQATMPRMASRPLAIFKDELVIDE